MALLDLQQKMKEIGRIRIGDSTPKVSAKGNAYRQPHKLGTFKFTTRSASIAARVAEVFGGTVVHEDHLGFGVVTEVSEIGVTIPPGDGFVSQAYEQWDGGACQRRCDGLICLTWKGSDRVEVPCMCPSDEVVRLEAAKSGHACKVTTRLSVIVPDLPDVGVWRLDTKGGNAAGEIGATAKILIAARSVDVYLPAKLWLDYRESKIPGQATREFYVPMLTLEATLRELSAASGTFREALPAAPPDRKAITAGVRPTETVRPEILDSDEPIDAEIVEDTPPRGDAQEIADRASTATSRALLTALHKRAEELHVADADVTINGATGSLRGYLDSRIEAIG